MKTFKLILICAVGLVVFAVGLKLALQKVSDNMAKNAAERAAETQTVKSVDTSAPQTDAETIDTELVFEPIETETEAETEIETVNEVAYVEETPAVVEEAPAVVEAAIPNDDDVMLLARIIQNEAGADFATDEHQRAVASVVINRVADPRFPDTVYGVITQGWNGECPIQYAVGGFERFYSLVPTDRAIANAEYVLTYGSTVSDAIWQAEFVQGEVVAEFAYPEIKNTVTYICR